MATGQTQHQKKRLFLLKAGKTCPLTSTEAAGFNAVVVYSFLVYRLKMKKGDQHGAAVTNKQIQRGTGLCRSRTIPKALTSLEQHGLAGYHENRAFAHQGQSTTWFVQIKDSQNKPWYARFAYFPIWIPSNHKDRLTPRQNALYWLMTNKPCQTQSYYALCLGIAAKTVATAVEKLRGMGLLSWSQLEPVEIPAHRLVLWQDKAKRKLKSQEFRLSQLGVFAVFSQGDQFEVFRANEEKNCSAYDQFCDQLDGYGNRMRAAGFSTVEITEYWETTLQTIASETCSVEPLERFVFEFRSLFEHAEAVTLGKRAAGLFSGSNSLGLLKLVTHQAIQQLKVAWENKRTYGGMCLWSWSPT